MPVFCTLSGAKRTSHAPHHEHRALARFARHSHVAAHHARELARQSKTESRAAITALLPRASLARRSIHIGAHPGAQLRNALDRVRANLKRAQVEVAGGAGGAPARVFALGGDQPDLDGDAAVAERRNAHAETVAELERLDQV